MAPAHAIKMQFEQAEDEIRKDPAKLAVWMPILNQFGPSLLVECDQQIDLSKSLVRDWLSKYMFAGDADAATKADNVADWLGDWKSFRSHGRPVGLDELRGSWPQSFALLG
jgi:hypothetical protein